LSGAVGLLEFISVGCPTACGGFLILSPLAVGFV